MEKENVGSFIAILRKTKGYTQQALAEKIGVSSKTVSKWECGDGMPDIMVLPAIASVLGVSIEELLLGKRSQNIRETGANQGVSAESNANLAQNFNNSGFEAENKNVVSENNLRKMVVAKKIKFRNISILSLGVSLLAIILQVVLFMVYTVSSQSLTMVIWILGIVLTLAAIIIQAVNISSAHFDAGAICDNAEYAFYKKSLKTTIYDWSYFVFALALIGAILCVVSLGL